MICTSLKFSTSKNISLLRKLINIKTSNKKLGKSDKKEHLYDVNQIFEDFIFSTI